MAKYFIPHFLKAKNLVPMAKIRKNYSSVWEKWAKESILAKNGQILAKKSKTRIFARKVFSPFFKRPKYRFLWQKSGKNGLKRAFLAKNGKILAKKLKTIIFGIIFLPFKKKEKKVPMSKIRKNYSSVWEKWTKKSILPKTDTCLPKN